MQIRHIGSSRFLRRHLGRRQLHPRQDELPANPHSQDRPRRVERLREVQPPLAGRRRPELRHERVGRRLQNRRAASHREQRHQERRILPAYGRRPEQHHPRPKQAQPRHHAHLVSPAPHQQRGRNRHAEVPGKVRRQHQLRAEPRQLERLAELLHQNVRQVVRHPPQKEQHQHHHEQRHLPQWKHRYALAALRCTAARRCRNLHPRAPACPLDLDRTDDTSRALSSDSIAAQPANNRPAQSRLAAAHLFAARESVLHAESVSPICPRWRQPARPSPSALPPQPHRIAGHRTGSHAAHALPEAAQPLRPRRQRRRNRQLQRLRHREARRRQHPQQPPHLPQQHGRRTHHPALRRQAARRLRVQLRQLPLHPELHLHPPTRPEPAAQRADRRPRDHLRIRRPHAQLPRRPALPRRRRRHHPLQAHAQRRRGPSLPVPRRLLLQLRSRAELHRQRATTSAFA